MWINGKKVIDDWAKHVISERSGSIELDAGKKYDIKIEYFNDNSESFIQLFWSSTGQVKEIIPQHQLYLQ